MDKSPEARSPLSQPPTSLGSRRLWLVKIGFSCFAVGALTSTLLALLPRFSFGRNAVAATPKIAGISSLVQQAGSRGLGAFPGETAANHLCLLVPTEAALGKQPAEVQGAAIASGLLKPAFAPLQTVVDPTLVKKFDVAPWPDIHEAARAARVPVLMYHDILPEKEVFFDVTVEEFEAHLQLLKAEGNTPITLDQLVNHLRTGAALPPKPVLLTFDDGYEGHYTYVYPLLKKYGFPATFSLFTGKLDGEVAGRSTITWEQAKEMAADPLITIASHSVLHPPDLRELDDAALQREVVESKARLEAELGIPIRYFTYPEGKYDDRVAQAVAKAGYDAALTMSNDREWFANESESLLEIGRFGQSSLAAVIPEASAGREGARETAGEETAVAQGETDEGAIVDMPTAPKTTFDFSKPIQVMENLDVEGVTLSLVQGGRPGTVHADTRYQLVDILARTNAQAGVDGGFFSLEYLDSNVMIGPVLSQATQVFVPGNPSENPLLNGRPLALIGPTEVKFVPFDADKHNTLSGLQAEMPYLTDAFVGAAWLVKDGKAQPPEAFGNLFDFDAERHRAFWGINRAGQPMIGVSKDRVDSVTLGELLQKVGFRDAIMLDSGASTSLAYGQESLVDYEPRPVPHMVALLTPEVAQGNCPLTFTAPADGAEDLAEATF